jgi:hypothetical protein
MITEKAEECVILKEHSQEFLKKAALCTKPSDAETFVRLALDLGQQAHQIESDLKSDSAWLYMAYIVRCGAGRNYRDYCDFCARNAFHPISDSDYQSALTWLSDQDNPS